MRDYVLCVDLGGTKTYIGRGKEDGEIEDIRRFTIDFSDQATVLRQLFESIDGYLWENCRELPSARAIGIGLKGYADRSQGVWKSCMTIPKFSPVNITRIAYEKYGIPTVIDNDVRAATLAELYYGAGKQYKDFIYYNVGTGIAIGIVSDSKLIRGSTFYAGELGHLITEPDGNLYQGGNGGYLEEIAAGAAILQQVKGGLADYPKSGLRPAYEGGTLTSHTVFTMAEQGDELAGKITRRVLRSIQISVVAITDLLNPEAIIFGGGVVADGLLLPKIKEYVYQYALRPSAQALRDIRLSSLGADRVGILGANAIGWEDLIKIK
jgi:predicted NBD/HSP70 family sugar kinase